MYHHIGAKDLSLGSGAQLVAVVLEVFRINIIFRAYVTTRKGLENHPTGISTRPPFPSPMFDTKAKWF